MCAVLFYKLEVRAVVAAAAPGARPQPHPGPGRGGRGVLRSAPVRGRGGGQGGKPGGMAFPGPPPSAPPPSFPRPSVL
eukprot:3485138-Pyramimonas_sp.AAC.1